MFAEYMADEPDSALRSAFHLTLERALPRIFSPSVAALTTRRFHFYERRTEAASG